ncbi:MAG: hypothetical protein ACLFVU_11570 [Phycisphaerae bacterium]
MDSDFFQRFLKAVSNDRIDAYRKDGADEATTAARYLWNIALCESLYSPLQMCEIGLRNAVHHALTAQFGTDQWYDRPNTRLDKWAHNQVQEAKSRIAKRGKPLQPGRVVAELHFGFWTTFFNRYHDQTGLAAAVAGRAFPGLPRRQRKVGSLEKRFRRIRNLRNRVFHHERISHFKDLPEQHGLIVQAIGWMSPELEDMVLKLDRFAETHGNGIDPLLDTVRQHWSKEGT